MLPIGDIRGNHYRFFVTSLLTYTICKCLLQNYLLHDDDFSLEVPVCTQSKNLPLTSTFFFDRQVDFIEGTILLLQGAPIESTIQALESMNAEFNRTTSDKSNIKMNVLPDTTCHKADLCTHITSDLNIETREEVVTKMFENLLWYVYHVHRVYTMHDLAAKSAALDFLSNLAAIKEELPQRIVIRYATKSIVI